MSDKMQTRQYTEFQFVAGTTGKTLTVHDADVAQWLQDIIEDRDELVQMGALDGRELLKRAERAEADLAAARALNEAMIANLPGPYYMDPPDGGSVNPEEQMRRLAKDAERYRWIKKQSIKMATAKDDFSCYDADYTVSILFRKRPPSLNGHILVAPQGNELDAAIDAALDKQRSGE